MSPEQVDVEAHEELQTPRAVTRALSTDGSRFELVDRGRSDRSNVPRDFFLQGPSRSRRFAIGIYLIDDEVHERYRTKWPLLRNAGPTRTATSAT